MSVWLAVMMLCTLSVHVWCLQKNIGNLNQVKFSKLHLYMHKNKELVNKDMFNKELVNKDLVNKDLVNNDMVNKFSLFSLRMVPGVFIVLYLRMVPDVLTERESTH